MDKVPMVYVEETDQGLHFRWWYTDSSQREALARRKLLEAEFPAYMLSGFMNSLGGDL